MSRLVTVLSTACAAGIALTSWSLLARSDGDFDVPKAGGAHAARQSAQAAELERARRTCAFDSLDAVVTALHVETQEDGATADAWRLYASALLERSQMRSHLRGVRVGEPIWSELPEELAQDLDDGLAAVEKARALGDDSAELHRIEAGLMSQHITGLTSALKWNGRITAALEAANERRPDDALLHTALGMRKLLAPRWLGHDPDKAIEHFSFAAKARPTDERPALFTAMAYQLQQKRMLAIEWLEKAIARNPNNRFARVVLKRLKRGEDEPFGRDVTEAELAAL